MSLFKVRDCWSTTCGRGETFGCDALMVDDLFGTGDDNVIVGSLDGVLRVYGVHSSSASDLRYSPSDLLVEVQMDCPVLQVSTGKLISCSPNKYIAVLHPFSIVVHGLNCVAGSTNHGDQYVLETMYEHKFERSAYQMIVGPFGGGSGARDFACVVSLDGVVSVYEQQAFGFRTSLSNYLHPFPMKYVRSVDAFITLNADLCLACYKYQELADPGLKQKWPFWSCNLGETVYDIHSVDTTPSATTIHVLGERNYYCFQGNGVLWFMKRLQFTPCCFHPYILGEHSEMKTMCMIVSDTDTVLIYNQTKLLWSAKLSFHPCIIAKASFKALQGCIVLLSETGDLRFCYLGTEPMIFMAPERPIQDYKDTKDQLSQLKNDLQNISLQNEADTLQPLLKLNSRIVNARSEGLRKLCDIETDVSPSLTTSTVQITFHVVAPLVVSPTVVHLKDLTESVTIRTTAYRENDDVDSVVSSLECMVCAYYSKTSEVPGSVQQTIRLPLSLAYEVHQMPSSNLGWSAKILVDESPVTLKMLFKEFADLSSSELCFRTLSNTKYVWVSSLPAIRSYEIRSTSPEYSNVIFEEILSRHRDYYKSKKCIIHCDKNEMPIADLYRTIDEHTVLKGRLETEQEEIASLCSQYRIIQKCLFNKLKENTVLSVSGLSILIDDTHETLTDKMSEIILVQQELKVKFSELMSLVRLLVTMLSLCSKNDNILEEFKGAVVHFTENQNWENIVLQSLNYLVGNEIMFKVQNDDPAHLVMNLRTLIDHVIQNITSVKDNLPEQLKRDNSRGAVSPILETEEDFYI